MIDEQLGLARERVNTFLKSTLPDLNNPPARLHQAMHYAVLNGGKRMRPLFVYAVGHALNLQADQLDPMACAVELIHAYSLIHDDLPAMDNDDLRRGIPTCHRRFDEATAILAGDALQALAFEVLASMPNCRIETLSVFAKACGSYGMAGGQAIDLESIGLALNVDDLIKMHQLKTGALINCAVTIPAINVGVDSNIIEHLNRYGSNVGLAFQIHDDILDIEGETSIIGKPRGSDENQNKPTFPACIGLNASRAMAAELLDEALESLKHLPGEIHMLDHLARYTISRDM